MKVYVPRGQAYIELANGTRVKRLGFVITPIEFIFHGLKGGKRVKMKKQFELMDITQSMIVGVDIIPTLFPRDEILKYISSPAQITDLPANVSVSQILDKLKVPATYSLSAAPPAPLGADLVRLTVPATVLSRTTGSLFASTVSTSRTMDEDGLITVGEIDATDQEQLDAIATLSSATATSSQ